MTRPWQGIIGAPHTPASFEQYVSTLKFAVWRPQFCVLHNTGIPTLKDWPRVPGPVRMTNLERYYKYEAPNGSGRPKGWSAGPHLFIAPDYIWTFTPLWVPGVHAPSWNGVAWGIEMIGDYDTELFDPRVRVNAIAALATLHRFASLAPGLLRYHKEDPKTTHYGCPGKNVGDKQGIISLLRSALGTGADFSGPDFSDVTSGHSSTAAIARPILKFGSRDHENVSVLQVLLRMQGVNAPGTFGPATDMAVREFQRGHGLQADGIVGEDTWKELYAERNG